MLNQLEANMRKTVFILGLGIVAVMTSCTPDSEQKTDNFDRGLILKQAADSLILPSFHTFSVAATTLDEQVTQFNKEPSQTNLTSLRSAWLNARLQWKACEPFKFGPIENMGLTNAMDIWPADTAGVSTSVKNYDGKDSYLLKVGSDKKGFSAIEYLIFGNADDKVLTTFEDSNRRAYLKLLSADLVDNIDTIIDAWKNGYADSFQSNDGNDAGAGSTLLANELIHQIEVTKNFRVSTPLGSRTGSSTPLPDKLESPFALKSKELLLASLDATQTVFTGGNGQGFDDYLDALGIIDDNGKLLSEKINEQIALCKADAEALNGSMKDALESNKDAVTKLYVDLQQLTLLIKTEMMSQLGLLVVFSDNDGD